MTIVASAIATVQQVVLTLSACGGVGIAMAGLSAWRKQLTGTHEFELARQTLINLLRFRDAVTRVRAPFMSSGEGAELSAEAGEAATNIPWEAFAYQARWSLVQDAAANLEASVVETEVLWGEEVQLAARELYRHVSRLRLATAALVEHKGDPQNSVYTKADREILFEREGDAYSTELARIVQTIEAIIRPRLEGQSQRSR